VRRRGRLTVAGLGVGRPPTDADAAEARMSATQTLGASPRICS